MNEIRDNGPAEGELATSGAGPWRTPSGGWSCRREEGAGPDGGLFTDAGQHPHAGGGHVAEPRDIGPAASKTVHRLLAADPDGATGQEVATLPEWDDHPLIPAQRPVRDELRFRGPMEVAWLDRVEIWSRIQPLLVKLCERQHRHGMTVQGLQQRIADGRYKLWVLGDLQAIFCTALYAQQNGRLVLSLSWAAGEDALHPTVVLPVIEEYARAQDCYAIEIMGRKGWERVVRDYGFTPFYVGVLKEL